MRPRFRPQLAGLEDRLTPAAGDLDLTFGGDGLATSDFASDGPAVAVQADGKVVLASRAFNPKGNIDFAVARAIIRAIRLRPIGKKPRDPIRSFRSAIRMGPRPRFASPSATTSSTRAAPGGRSSAETARPSR